MRRHLPPLPWAASLLFAAALVLSSARASSAAVVEWVWRGSVSSNWQTAGNWTSNPVVPGFNGTYSGTDGYRLNVNNGSGHALVYDAALGTTTYGPSPNRGLVIGGTANGGSGGMRITGGTFSTVGAVGPDVIGQAGNAGTLIIQGGNFLSGSAGTAFGVSGGGTGTIILTSGAATIPTLDYQAFNGTLWLNGGTFTTNRIRRTAGTNSIVNLNGGTLRASTSTTTFLEGLTRANVRNAGAVIDTQAHHITLAQPLVHSTLGGDAALDGGLRKLGGGTLTLSGNNTYNGTTTVQAGRLNVTGTHTGGGLYTVKSGGTLGGTGTIASSVLVEAGGRLSPGIDTGTLNTGSLTLSSGSRLDLQISGSALGSYDRLDVSGTANLGDATLNILRAGDYLPELGTTFFFLTSTDAINSTFDGLANDSLFLQDSIWWQIRYNVNAATNNFTSGSGTDIALRAMATTVPEPSSYALLILGGLAVLPILRRKKQSRLTGRPNSKGFGDERG